MPVLLLVEKTPVGRQHRHRREGEVPENIGLAKDGILLIRILIIMKDHDPACEEPDCRCQKLGAIGRGKAVVVRHLQGAAGITHRLREMGFREDSQVTVICPGGALIAQVMGSRVCLSREMADAVLVTPA